MEAIPQPAGFPKKPKLSNKKKSKASKVKIVSNYYPVKLVHAKTNKELFILSWSISLGAEVPLDARKVYEEHVRTHKEKIKSKMGFFLFSGQKIYSIGDPKQIKEGYFKFEPATEGEPSLTLNLDPNVYSMTQVSQDPRENGEIVKVMNLIVKANMQKMNLYELGYNKKYYDDKPHTLTLGDWSFVILKGIKSSISICEKGIMLNLDYNLRITRYYDLWEETKFLMEAGQSMSKIMEENVIGRSFILMHANHRIIRVSRVDKKTKVSDAFPNKKFKNYIDYFKKRYNFKISNDDQFFCVELQKNYKFPKDTPKSLIKLDRRKREYVEQETFYPSSVLRPTGMLDMQRKDHRSMKEFARYTKLFPDQRMEKIEEFISKNNSLNPAAKNKINARAIDFGTDIKMVISNEPESNLVSGKILQFPAIQNGKGKMKPNPKNGNYVMRDAIFSKNYVMKNYAVVYDRFQSKNLEKAINMLKKCSKAYGIKVKNPSVELEVDSRNVDPARLLDKILEEDDSVDMVLFLVSNRNRIYETVKNYFTKQGVMTQFFTNLGNRTNLSVYSKVLLQKVAKLNGVLWKIESAFDNSKELNCLMGVDIVHSRKGLIVSLVSTEDKSLSRHFSIADKVQKSTKKDTRASVAEKIAELFSKAYDNFNRVNGSFPDNIVIYRIGSGNSIGLDDDLQYEAILCNEQIENAAGGGGKAKLVYFAVARQITERIFEQFKGEPRNPKGGLIVHQDIVRKDRYEFYMVAQNVNQGSATPTKYTCVFNSSNFSQEELHKTTYYQAFNYANWQGPVKVPGVAMYALKCSQFWADNTKRRDIDLKRAFASSNLYFL